MGLRFMGGPYDGKEIDHALINKHGHPAPVYGDLGMRPFVLMPDDPSVWDRIVRGEKLKVERLVPYERVSSGTIGELFFVASRPGEFERALSEAKLKIHSRAKTALDALSETDRRKVIESADTLQHTPPGNWPKEKVIPLGENGMYLLRVTPELRAFIRINDGEQIEVVDLVREDTLHLFLERQREASTRR